MALLDIALDQITEADLQRLIAAGDKEQARAVFKQAEKANARAERLSRALNSKRPS